MAENELFKIFTGVVLGLILVSVLMGCQSVPKTATRGVGSACEEYDEYARLEGDCLGGRTFKELRDQYRYDLYEDFLPFLDKYVIDHQYGGFMCNTDREGNNISTNKNTIFTGRGIWVYSFLYNHFSRDKKHLEVARKSIDLLMRQKPQSDELWPSFLTREGDVLPPTGLQPGQVSVEANTAHKHIYGDLFIAEGLTEYAKAVGDDAYWNMARDILFKCVRMYDRDDYGQYVDLSSNISPEATGTPGLRIIGHWMLLLRLSTQMLEYKEDAEIEQLARRCVDAVMNYHYNPEYDLINEVLNHDMSRVQAPWGDLAYTGHSIEVLWMILVEAERIGDQALFDRAARMIKRHLEVSWDDVYGGFYLGAWNVNENTWDVKLKGSWAQEEVLVATMLIYEKTRAAWARDWFNKTYAFVQDKYPLRKHGYSLWNCFTDRKITFVKDYYRIENYHHPRHLMLNLLALDRMIEQNNK